MKKVKVLFFHFKSLLFINLIIIFRILIIIFIDRLIIFITRFPLLFLKVLITVIFFPLNLFVILNYL
jgi:hypothetical protein